MLNKSFFVLFTFFGNSLSSLLLVFSSNDEENISIRLHAPYTAVSRHLIPTYDESRYILLKFFVLLETYEEICFCIDIK